jgi:putative nucleotidyltransferase with HDIG domain
LENAQTVTQLGEILGRNLEPLRRGALEHVTVPELFEYASLEASIGTLLDRLCLSLNLAKPIGLVSWGERESSRVGRAAVGDMLAAATHAISIAASDFTVERRRVLAALEQLANEVQRGAFGSSPFDLSQAPEVERSSDALLAMLAERDAGTLSHSKATAVWARRLAAAMGMSREEIEFVEVCALMHDIGKVGTPEAILNKPGPLTAEEWTTMKEHSAAGGRILSQVPSLRRCVDVVRSHHERFDGTGYPDRLCGPQIPLESRIIAVAESFHAMVTDRPYRAAIFPRQAMQILEEGKGSQWDPAVVDAMLGLFSHRDGPAREHVRPPRLIHSA